MIDYKQIVSYSKCQCGAITVYFENGGSNSMNMRTKRLLGIDLRKVHKDKITYNCNHCVNHWGIDLCACGSGERVGKCSCGSNEAIEEWGEAFDSFGAMLKNFIG